MIEGDFMRLKNVKNAKDIINNSKLLILNITSGRSINFDEYISDGSTNYKDPQTNEYYYWNKFYNDIIIKKYDRETLKNKIKEI